MNLVIFMSEGEIFDCFVQIVPFDVVLLLGVYEPVCNDVIFDIIKFDISLVILTFVESQSC